MRQSRTSSNYAQQQNKISPAFESHVGSTESGGLPCAPVLTYCGGYSASPLNSVESGVCCPWKKYAACESDKKALSVLETVTVDPRNVVTGGTVGSKDIYLHNFLYYVHTF